MTVPDVTLLPFGGKAPRLDPAAFVAPGARLIGGCCGLGPDAIRGIADVVAAGRPA